MPDILRKFTLEFHVPGTLTADLNIRWTVPSDCTLLHVSAVGSNANDATITVGTSVDPDGYIQLAAIGDSNTPVEFDLDDFNGDLVTDQGNDYPHILDGTIIVVALVYGDVLGDAAADVTIVLTFSEG
jgi:hypothetical protein